MTLQDTDERDAPATIHLVDDDPSVLRALRRVVTAAGHACETWASAEAFLARPETAAQECVIIDLQLPGAGGLELQAQLAVRDDSLPVIFLTGRGDVRSSVDAMKGGALDFLTKPTDAKVLLAAIEAALAHGRLVRAERVAETDFCTRLSRLTPREHEVLELVVAGQLNKQIAGELGVAEKTVKVHRARVMTKLGVRTIADLVRLVVQHR